MFEKSDYIVYGNSGVCQVDEITTLDVDGVPKDRLYYVLIPVNQSGSKIFTPVNSQKSQMRKIISKSEAVQLIEEIPEIEQLWIPDDKQREEQYKACMKNSNCKDWIRIIKTLYLRKEERSAQGKKVTATDEKYLRMAEDYLYSELSIPLGVEKEKMGEYIIQKMVV